MSRRSGGMDMTVGSPTKLLVVFAIPMLIGAVFQLMYNMVDTIVLGKFVSAEALASVGATTSTTGMVIMIGNALTNAVSILVSHAWGAKDEAQVRRIVGGTLSVVAVCSLAIGAASVALARPLMRLLNTPENILDGATLYVQIVCGMYIAQMLYNTSAAVLRAIGDSRTPLAFLILCSLMNIALDLIFVLGLNAGVAGVAWATVISQLFSAVLCCAYMWKKYPALRFERNALRPGGDLLASFGRIALPMTAQNLMLMVGQMVISRVINGFGSDIVAAYTVGGKVEQLATVIISQVAFSFSIYAGQNYGAKRYARIEQGVRRALALLGAMTAVAMVMMLGFGRSLALLFVDAGETAILDAAMEMLRVEAAFMPALCAIWLYNSALRGMGLIRPTVVSGMLELVSKVGFSIALSAVYGTMGIWFASPLGWIIGLAMSGGYYYFAHWKERALQADAAADGGV